MNANMGWKGGEKANLVGNKMNANQWYYVGIPLGRGEKANAKNKKKFCGGGRLKVGANGKCCMAGVRVVLRAE